METTFITIHDHSLDARLLYASNSITDILGYQPNEVVGKSCWEYFHPDEIPFARAIHGRGVQLDKAAVLNYCQIKNRDGRWVGCECVFTIVDDVMVGCTSIYKTSASSQKRATAAPVIRQLFSSSPRDPRYHMLSYISHKFSQEIRPQKRHEPRAALFLNRFSRTSTIMYATNGLADVLGVTADEMNGKSFYYCIEENCLEDAVKCLESAKANDSIAYLRFWFRDPRRGDQADGDELMDGTSSGDDDDGGVHLDDRMDEGGSEHAMTTNSSSSQVGSSVDHNSTERSSLEHDPHRLAPIHPSIDPNSRSSSGNSTDLQDGAEDAIFDQPATRHSSTSSLSYNTPDDTNRAPALGRSPRPRQVEIEAVISCTSDGLVVVLRRARALVPQISGASTRRSYTNGCFASPWATEPIMPGSDRRRHAQPDQIQPDISPGWPTVGQADTASMRGPDQEDFMNSIREVAVFAWSLTGINGSLARYGRGRPTGQSLPPAGLPIWKSDFKTSAELQRHPHHGNNPQETRQHHTRGSSSNNPNHSGSNNVSYGQADGYNENIQNGIRNDEIYGHNSHNATSTRLKQQNQDGHHTVPHSNYTNGSTHQDRPNHYFSDGYLDANRANVRTKYNDWYQEGPDTGYGDGYRDNSSNEQIHASHNAPNDRFGLAVYESAMENIHNGFHGDYGRLGQDQAQYYNEPAMESKDTQSYLKENTNGHEHYNENGVHHIGYHNWLPPQQRQN